MSTTTLRATDQLDLVSPYEPAGDQPQAIAKLVEGFRAGKKHQCLLGVTGSGKTFTVANVAAQLNVPVLVMSHNKTLAAQLYEEFKELFPHDAVEYFVSYYDYYQPEAYIPQRDIYIEKDSSKNDDLDRLRLSATSSLVSRRDAIIVASVSCIFGLGSPEAYKAAVQVVETGMIMDRDALLRRLVDLQYTRNDFELKRGTFRVRGDVVELHPAHEQFAYRIELFGDEIDKLEILNPLTGASLGKLPKLFIFPGSLRNARRARGIGDREHSRRAQPAGHGVPPPRKVARSAEASGTHQVRRGNDPRSRALLGYRELLSAP